MPEPIPRSTFSMRTGIATLGSVAPAIQLEFALGRLGEDVPTGPITHELMHHNAANSPVNVALQYRWLELLRAALSTPSSELEGRVVLLAERLAATEALLQPIAEGLAHFAEFDCCVPEVASGESAITAVDLISLRLLSLKRTRSGDMHQAAVAEKLSLTGRRADVLSHPLYPESANDAYLLGYLLLKTAWNAYLESDAPRWPAGVFAEYVHYWVYEDWALAELLLHAGAASDHAVVDHLSTRLQRLLADDLGARVDMFRRDKNQRERRGMLPRGPEEREHGPLAGLGLKMRDIVDAHIALGRFFLSRIGPKAPVTQGPVARPGSARERMHNAIVGPLPADEPRALDAYVERNPGAPRDGLTMLDFLLEIPRMNNARVRLVDLPVELDVADDSLAGLRVEGAKGPWHEPPAAMRIPAGRRPSSRAAAGPGEQQGEPLAARLLRGRGCRCDGNVVVRRA